MKSKFFKIIALCGTFLALTSATIAKKDTNTVSTNATVEIKGLGGYTTENGKQYQFVAFGATLNGFTFSDIYRCYIYIYNNYDDAYNHRDDIISKYTANVTALEQKEGNFYFVFNHNSSVFVDFKEDKTYYATAMVYLNSSSRTYSIVASATGNFINEYSIK